MRLIVDEGACAGHRTPGGHPERPERVRWILDALDRSGLLQTVERQTPREATMSEILAVHEVEFVDAVERLAARGGGAIDAETVMSAGSWRAARIAAGGAITAAESALAGEPAFALVRPPGHHSTRERAQGFCLLNNVAIATEALIRTGRARRIAIVDYDVHHGNGTQDIFYDRADVLFMSTHNAPAYPGTGPADEIGKGEGTGFTVNAPLPHQTGDPTWRRVVSEIFLPIVGAYAPDVIIVSAGFDAHARDPLGMMGLTGASFGWIHERLAAIAPVAAVLEGGYDPVGLAEGVVCAISAMAGSPVPPDHAPPPPDRAPPGVLEALSAVHGRTWAVINDP